MCEAGHTEAGVGSKRWEAVDRYSGCETDELIEAYTQMMALSRAAHAQALAALAVLDKRDVHRIDGATDMAGWVAFRAAFHPPTARSELGVARALVDLPHIGALAESGECSMDQLRPVVRLASPETDERWAGMVAGMTPAQLVHESRRMEPVSNAGAGTDHEERYVAWRNIAGSSMLAISGRLPADMGALVTKALSAIAEAAPPLAGSLGWEPWGARCADALVQCCTTALPEVSTSPRATVVVHVSADTLRAGCEATGQDGLFAHTTEGVALAPLVARRLACDARLSLILEGANGVPLGIGHSSRVVPAWLATLVNYRDEGRCRYPGCERTRGTQCHHIVHWADGGPTDLPNLVTLCSRHHHLVHEGGFTLGGDPDAPGGLWVNRPDGTRAGPPWFTLSDEVRTMTRRGPASPMRSHPVQRGGEPAPGFPRTSPSRLRSCRPLR